MRLVLLDCTNIFVVLCTVEDLTEELIFNIKALNIVEGSLLILLNLSLYGIFIWDSVLGLQHRGNLNEPC